MLPTKNKSKDQTISNLVLGVSRIDLCDITSSGASDNCPLLIGRTVALIDEVDTTVAWPRGGTMAVSCALDVTVGNTVAVGVLCVIGRILAVLVDAGFTAVDDVGLIVAVGGTIGTVAEEPETESRIKWMSLNGIAIEVSIDSLTNYAMPQY